jgi:hypothetical protein
MADMIPVAQQPSPAGFEETVRAPGLAWLHANGVPLDGPAPSNLKWNALWTQFIDHAHEVYGGHCAYLACYLELATGEVTIDHFVSKKSKPSGAYDWSNYRLSSLGANRIKGEKKVLDPFLVQQDWFQLELVSGKMFANPNLPMETIQLIKKSISDLKLDNSRCRKLRAQYFWDYCQNRFSANYLRAKSPFVYAEAARQGLL